MTDQSRDPRLLLEVMTGARLTWMQNGRLHTRLDDGTVTDLSGFRLVDSREPEGEPFTPEDVTLLTQTAHFLEQQEGGRIPGGTVWPKAADPWRALAPKLRDLAERIDAALP